MRLTRSAGSISFVSLGGAVVALTLSRIVMAQTEVAGDVLEPVPDVAHRPESSPEALPQVHVTSIGALSAAALESIVGPALRSSYSLDFSSAAHFGPEDLFRARIRSPASIHVWVDTSTPGSAQLYFANRDGTRYLARNLELSPSMDEMDREALAQTIEWSLQALAEGTAGLTRAEAEALFSEPPPERVTPAQHLETERPLGVWRRRTGGWLPEVALLHGWVLHSAELPATQGPVLRVGVDRLTAGHQFGFAVSAQYQYPQRHAEHGVALELQSVASRVEARYLATDLAPGSGLGVRLGGGVDAVYSGAEALDPERFEAEENRVNTVPLVTGGLLWQLRVEPSLRLELSVGIEVDLVETHYDVITSDGTTELVSRWPARPAASVGLELF